MYYHFVKKNFRFFFLFALSISVFNTINATDFYWGKVSVGDYDDPDNWLDAGGSNLNAIPTASDNVFLANVGFGHITVNFPAGGTYYADNFYAENATLNINGVSIGSVEIEVHGDLIFEVDVTTNYASVGSANKWLVLGPGSNNIHYIDTKGIDLNELTFDNIGKSLDLKSTLSVGGIFRFYSGSLFTNKHPINVGTMFVGVPGSSSNNSVAKNLYLENSTITCSSRFVCIFSDPGVVQYIGNYTISAPRFQTYDQQYDHLVLTNYDPPIDRDSLNMDVSNPVIQHLTIANDFLTRIGGNMTIGSTLEVSKPGKRIEFSTHENYSLFNELTINGNVTLPSGISCGALTTFTIKGPDDYFFKRTSGSVTFDEAFINNVKTSGGANFNVTNGKVLGAESYWNSSSEANSVDYYWIGGSGNWFDPTHWSLSPGGDKANCVPSVVDNVHIDKFSFDGPNQTIQMDYSKGTVCRNFEWSENPKNGTVELYSPFGYSRFKKPHLNTGSFIIGPESQFSTNKIQQLYQIWLNGSGDLHIDNPLTGVDLEINGSGSEFNITSDIHLDEVLNINAGTINTNNNDIYARAIQGSDGEKTFNLGKSHIESDSLVRFCSNSFSPTTINGAQASVKAKYLQYNGNFIKQIELSNNQLKSYNHDVLAEKVILSGTGTSKVLDSLVTDSLIFTSSAVLTIGHLSGDGLRVNKGIRGPSVGPEARIVSNSGTFNF